MIKLKTKFNKGTLHYEQIFRDDYIKGVAIYKVTDDIHNFGFYEVFRITAHQPDRFHEEEYELYPYDEAFGLWAWCPSDENGICKVLLLNFPEHPLTKRLMKYTTGKTYLNNGKKMPRFKLHYMQLMEEIKICQNRPGVGG